MLKTILTSMAILAGLSTAPRAAEPLLSDMLCLPGSPGARVITQSMQELEAAETPSVEAYRAMMQSAMSSGGCAYNEPGFWQIPEEDVLSRGSPVIFQLSNERRVITTFAILQNAEGKQLVAVLVQQANAVREMGA
jgi:hypothetical protein